MWLLVSTQALAATRIEIDPDARALRIAVDEDAPSSVQLRGPDLLPIHWERQDRLTALLPAVVMSGTPDLVIVDDSNRSYALVSDNVLPRASVNTQRYALVSQWHGQPSPAQRLRIVWLGLLFSLGLLLMLLIRRQGPWLAAGYATLWAGAIVIVLGRQPDLHQREVEESSDAYYSRSPHTLRIDILPGSRWVPTFESVDHLRVLAPRIEVRGSTAQIVFDLPAGGKILLKSDRE